MTYVVRRARRDDVAAIFAIRTAVRENHMSLDELAAGGITPAAVGDMIASQGAAAWIGLDGARPVGFSIARARVGDVFALFLLPSAEGRGLGTRLLAEAERWLASRGVTEAWLVTDGEPRLRAAGFYAAHGWRDAGREPDGAIRFVKGLR